jgi:thiol-disulfide isomerase/thioredoxin
MEPAPGDDDLTPGTAGDGSPRQPPNGGSPTAIEPGSLGAHPERHPDDLPPPDRSSRGIPSGVLWALALAVVVLAIASWVAFSTESSSTSADEIVRLDPNVTIGPSGLNAPEVDGQPVTGDTYTTFAGDTAALTEHRGRPLVVNFWASSCAPCITEMPAFEQVHQAVGDDVSLVGLAVQDQEDAARALAARTGVSYDLGFDPSGGIITDLGGVVLPTTVFVDAGGTIVESHPGQLDEAGLRSKIRDHFGIEVPAGS